MDYKTALKELNNINIIEVSQNYSDEVYISVEPRDFKKVCIGLHKILRAPVMLMFAHDERKEKKSFSIYCVFAGVKFKKWFIVKQAIADPQPSFDSLSKDVYSAALFERQIYEMFGVLPLGNPDLRRLSLHEEVWPKGVYPLRKDFDSNAVNYLKTGEYAFDKIEGEGIFEIPVGPVHAGIIGPGHFRFSAAGEPIINLSIRLGFTHRGVEKIFEAKNASECVAIAERVVGDSSFSHSAAFCKAIEKICDVALSARAMVLRAIFLELERLYNHVNDVGGIAIDVGFSFPAAYASVIKESLLEINAALTGSRYLRAVNIIGGVSVDISDEKKRIFLERLNSCLGDFNELKKMLYSSVSFMDRLDGTGQLRKKTAEDLGILGLAGRASGISLDLRRDFCQEYASIKLTPIKQENGDVLSRFNQRIQEFEDSVNLIKQLLIKLSDAPKGGPVEFKYKAGFGLGACEGWRGPVLYWAKIDSGGVIERCKIADASFQNWQALSFAVLGDIVPDFPVCNKSFDLSYAGNDL